MVSIKRIYVRRYSDSGDIVAYCEWSDGSRTEGRLTYRELSHRSGFTFGQHMHALFNRARREGLHMEREYW